MKRSHLEPTRLSVYLIKVALLRNARGGNVPNLIQIAKDCETYGAQGITVHPRPDERHIRYADIPLLKAAVRTEFNIEGNPTPRFLEMVLQHRPHQCTLVPDEPGALTSDHGWDFKANHNMLSPIVARLKSNGFRVALFADADPEGVRWAVDTGADRIELYTGPYAGTYDSPSAAQRELDALQATADAAREVGLGTHAGHDLTVANLPPLVARIPDLFEVSIGHGLTADALEYGMAATVKRFLAACGH